MRKSLLNKGTKQVQVNKYFMTLPVTTISALPPDVFYQQE